MLSSTAHALKKIPSKTNEELPPVDILEVTLKKLNDRFLQLTQMTNDKKSWDNFTEEKKLAIESNKYEIMRQVLISIQKQYGKKYKQNVDIVIKENSENWRKALFAVLMTTDIAVMTIGTFVGASSLMRLLPGVGTIFPSIVGGIGVGIESLIKYAMFKNFLQQGLGISPEPSTEKLLTKYEMRLALMEQINHLMVNNMHYTRSQGPVIYQYYTNILKSFNADMKKTQIAPYEEPRSKRYIRNCLSIINLGLNVASTYFAASLLLTTFLAPLVGTPIGWGIVGFVIAAQLLSKFIVRKTSIFTLMNPAAVQHDMIKDKLSHFKDRSKGIDQDLNTMRSLNKFDRMISDKEKLSKPSLKKPTRAAECPAFFKPGSEMFSVKMAKKIVEPKASSTNRLALYI